MAGSGVVNQLIKPVPLLGHVSMEESGRFRRSRDGVDLRPYPFPFRAALAISNDLDSIHWEGFEDFHRFVCGTKSTSYGEGLGLEVADSFWIWAPNPINGAVSLCYQLPETRPFVEAQNVPRIRELAQLGWLDTLHSFGNFGRTAGIRHDVGERETAELAIEVMERLGIFPKVWVNHSQSPSNVGGPWGFYQKADDTEHPLYCLDLLRKHGFRYFWIDPCISFAKFGDHLEFPDEAALNEAIVDFEWGHWIRRRDRQNNVIPALLETDPTGLRHQLLGFFNRTLTEVSARDGSTILIFKRHRGSEQPLETTFAYQVMSEDLDGLERDRGVVVAYQHFGRQGPRGRAPVISKAVRKSPPPPILGVHTAACLREIAERNASGSIFVATVQRLLDFLWMRDRIEFSIEKDAERWTITLGDVACNALGTFSAAEVDLNGLAFLVPHGAPEVVVRVNASAKALAMRRSADPQWPGQDAVFLPWKKLEWPE